MTVLRGLLCVLLVALAGCDGEQPGAPQPPREAQQAVQPVQPATQPDVGGSPELPSRAEPPATVPSPPAAPVEQSAAPSVAVRTPQVAAPPPRAVTQAHKEKPAPLDLSLPDELKGRVTHDAGAPPTEPQQLLPPLFGSQEPAPRSFELGGRLITTDGDQQDDSWHSMLDGAELELRFRR